MCTCEVVAPYTSPYPGDCADDDPSVHPDADEVCNGVDDNCNDAVDEAGNVGCTLYFYDADQDGFGTVFNQQCLCQPEGLYNATEKGDCDDEDGLIGPGTSFAMTSMMTVTAKPTRKEQTAARSSISMATVMG